MNESEAYSAKAARAGKDIGKPGKNFDKIAAKAAKKYGSEERGKKVAGAILRNLRMKEDLAYLHTLEYLDQENIELESLSEEQINELLAGFRQRKVNRLEKKADQLERINKAKSRIRAAKRVSRQNSKVRKVGRAIGKTLFGSSAVRPKPVASARPRPVAKPAVKPVSSVKPKPKKLGEDSMKESLTYSKFLHFLRKEESEYINMGGARVKNDEKSVLKHVQKTFPNVKKVKKDPQHGWSPVFKEATSVTDYNPKSQGGTRKELLAKYAKTKDPKHAESARKAGASQGELKAARMEEVELDEMDKSQPSSSRGAEGLPLGKKAEPIKTDKAKQDALKALQKQYKKVKEEVELEENYRVLATKGIGAERKEDIKVGHGVDYYHPKDGSKHMGKIHSMGAKSYVVKDDRTGEKHKFQYYRRMEEGKEIIGTPHEPKGRDNVRAKKMPLPGKVEKIEGNKVYFRHKNGKLYTYYRKMEEEVEQVGEARASQRHPLEGHPYHKKSNVELVGIAKDAIKAAEAMKSHNPDAENKYRDQANDSATVRHWRQQNGTPDWYKKKYGHVKEEAKPTLAKFRQKEEVEQVDEKAPPGKKYERMVKHIKKGYEGGGLTKQEKGIAYATAWKSYNKGK